MSGPSVGSCRSSALNEPPTAVASDGSHYRVLADRVERERRGTISTLPLNDPGRPIFLRLPVARLDDGRSLRAAAFERWAHHVKWGLEWERAYRTRSRSPSPAKAAFGVVGGLLVGLTCVGVLVTWTLRPRANIHVEPTTLEAFGQALIVAVILFVMFQALTASARAWLARKGGFVHVDPRGIRVSPSDSIRPFDAVAEVRHDGWLRMIRITMDDGRVAWVPSEVGPLRRLDLVLAALHPPLADRLRESGALA